MIRRGLEKKSAEQEFMGALSADYEYKVEGEVVVMSSCSKEISSLDAQICYSAANLSARFGLLDEKERYVTKSIRAGEESRCLKIRDRYFWAFSFRQKRYWGYLIIGGPPLEDQQVQSLVTKWVARLK
ncbi:hypothetical protein ABS71_11770 [bacterium SCN 62-11]|nr:MAG: hypothetical protein ABS71_11770 [bacterium SCN 62-11]